MSNGNALCVCVCGVYFALQCVVGSLGVSRNLGYRPILVLNSPLFFLNFLFSVSPLFSFASVSSTSSKT